VLGNVRGGNRCDRSPAVAQNECRYGSRKGDRRSQNRVGDGSDERRARLIRVLVLSGCAATVCLRLADNACRCGSLRVSVVHRTLAVSAARHTRFGRRCPTGADRCVPDRNKADQGEDEQAPAERHDMFRMPDWAADVKTGLARAGRTQLPIRTRTWPTESPMFHGAKVPATASRRSPLAAVQNIQAFALSGAAIRLL
jgi:hypothetical protein